MNTWVVLAAGTLAFALTATDVSAQAPADVERAEKARTQQSRDAGQPDAATPPKAVDGADAPAASTQTGGDTKPNAVDPAQGTKTGGNVGEGASYSRSNEKGQSTTK
jgi:hypothetical protein